MGVFPAGGLRGVLELLTLAALLGVASLAFCAMLDVSAVLAVGLYGVAVLHFLHVVVLSEGLRLGWLEFPLLLLELGVL